MLVMDTKFIKYTKHNVLIMATLAFPKSSHQSGLHYFRRNPHPKKEDHCDCGVRSICLAFDLPYNKVWKAATKVKREWAGYYYDQWGRKKKSQVTATSSLSKGELIRTLWELDIHDWEYTPISRGTKFHAKHLPDHCIAAQADHWVCVKDGAIWDSWDSRGARPKRLEGYFSLCA